MRIAYVAPYQGALLQQRRPVMRHLALAANVKMELVAELLRRRGHDVEILSQGEVAEGGPRFYPAFREPAKAPAATPVHYASALPIRFVNGWWSSCRLLTLFRQRHAASAFDLVIIYNLNSPQVACGLHAAKRLGLPVIVEYEDDAIVDVSGNEARGARARLRLRAVNRMIGAASGCIGVSPFLLDRFPRSIPKLLLRGVVTEDIVSAAPRASAERSDWVTFSGALYRRKGLEPLISAWRMARPPGWELHIAGHGELADRLREMCAGDATVVFHGLIDRATNADLLNRSKICINPHDLSATPGNVFAFKIIEYLAAGAHVLTTPMGPLEPELERGITYLEDNTPAVIAATLRRVIEERTFDREASGPARQRYGPAPVAQALDDLVGTVLAASRTAHGQGRIAERSDGPRDPKLDRPPAGSASSLLSEDS